MHNANSSKEQEPPLLRKSRSGCRDCKLRKVKVPPLPPTINKRIASVMLIPYTSVMKLSLFAQIVADDT